MLLSLEGLSGMLTDCGKVKLLMLMTSTIISVAVGESQSLAAIQLDVMSM